MKLPNGYGSVVKLSGKRRKPWAVRISYYKDIPGQKPKLKRKYIGYYSSQKQALSHLAEYNNKDIVDEHEKYLKSPTFSELYKEWLEYRGKINTLPGESALRGYDYAYKQYESLQQRRVTSIRVSDVQECISNNVNKSKTTHEFMRVIIKGMWKYALMQNYVKDDLTQHLVFTSNYIGKQVHTRFTDKEIKQLWDNVDKVKNIDIILIYIYTGLRPTELLDMLTENIHMEERYMVGGIKTEAGRNRIIPIHEAIAPLVQRRLDMNHKYLIISNRGTHYGRSGYQCSNFNKVMKTLGMTHVPHDGRYTFASLADSCEMNQTCRKIIMGHATTNKDGTAFKTGDAYSDLTQGVYTEKTLKQLLDEVNKLPTDFPDAEQPPT